MARGQVGQLNTTAEEEGIGTDKHGVGPLTLKGSKDRVDLRDCTCVEHIDL